MVGNHAVFQPPRYAGGRNEPSFRNARGSRNHSRDTASAVYYFITTGIKVTSTRTRFLGLAVVRRCADDQAMRKYHRRDDLFFFYIGT